MFKRVTLLIALSAIFVLLAAPVTVSGADQAYTEGVYFRQIYSESGLYERLEVTAFKQVDGDWRDTTVNFMYRMESGTQQIHYVFTISDYELNEDPDELEVSDDLGWGGLGGQILIYDYVGQQYHLVEFHISMFASEPAYRPLPRGRGFGRNAYLDGYILMDGELWKDFRVPTTPDTTEYAYNFSSQSPGY
ncbi:MAG: hypothetical protein KJ065_27625 [Anaerolineae bacterium]|nr:hypothetical protein [Anaerolineae bacterium]